MADGGKGSVDCWSKQSFGCRSASVQLSAAWLKHKLCNAKAHARFPTRAGTVLSHVAPIRLQTVFRCVCVCLYDEQLIASFVGIEDTATSGRCMRSYG